MSRRAGSLIELLVAAAILAVLIGLILGAIQKVRETAALMKSKNNLRQMILGTHQIAATQPERAANGLPKMEWTNAPYAGSSIHELLLPYVLGERKHPPSTATHDELMAYLNPNVATFRDQADPTIGKTHEQIEFKPESIWLMTTYSCNMPCFDRQLSFPWGLPDGASNTLAFAQTYFNCGNHGDRMRSWGIVFPEKPNEKGGEGTMRRASVADPAYPRDVLPVRDSATGQAGPSRPGVTFQVRPTFEEADATIAQTPYWAGLPVALFDGSVRTLSPGISEPVYWALYTPDGGEVPGDF